MIAAVADAAVINAVPVPPIPIFPFHRPYRSHPVSSDKSGRDVETSGGIGSYKCLHSMDISKEHPQGKRRKYVTVNASVNTDTEAAGSPVVGDCCCRSFASRSLKQSDSDASGACRSDKPRRSIL